MASPTPGNWAITASGFGTTRVLTMPTNPAPIPGELLLAFVAGETVTADTMAGWESVKTGGSGNESTQVFRRIATGSDTATSSGSLANRVGVVQIVAGWDGILGNVIGSTPATNTLNPSSLDMIASREHLFFAYARNSNNTITGAPTNYSNLRNTTADTHRIAIASRAVATQTEDPGVFAGTNSLGVAGTIGIRPGSAPYGKFFHFA